MPVPASQTVPARASRLPRGVLLLCLVALACGACGRRGSLEPPGGGAPERASAASPTAPAAARTLPGGIGLSGAGTAPADPEAVRAGDELPAAAVPAGTDSAAPVQTERGAKRGYKIPKEPFLLDAIL